MGITVMVPGEPVALARTRHTKAGRVYTPAPSKAFQQQLAWAAKCVMLGADAWAGPLHVDATFAFEWPARRPKSTRVEGELHAQRPDLDNLVKQLDALNGIVWGDDAQIASLTARKVWSATPQTIIRIRRLP